MEFGNLFKLSERGEKAHTTHTLAPRNKNNLGRTICEGN
jgi:hypothetical protein